MSRLALAIPLAFALSNLGCGASDGQVPMGLEISGLSAGDIGAVQVTVLAHGTAYLCSDLSQTCLRTRVAKPDGTLIPDVVKLRGDDGQDHNALRFTVDGAALLSSSGQTFSVHLPSGTNYMVVAEVLSPSAKLLASGCGVVTQVQNGDNSPLVVQAAALAVPPTCDPRID